MKIIEQSFAYVAMPCGDKAVKRIAEIGYVSHGTRKHPDKETAERFVKRWCIEAGHESLLEFWDITVVIITDRGISHEIVRHRIASYLQQSTRYVKYDNISFIKPLDLTPSEEAVWLDDCRRAEIAYRDMLKRGSTPEQARDVLPNSTATEIVVKMNLRAWRNFFKLRCDKHAHPKIRQLALMLLKSFKEQIPAVFGDLEFEE